MFALSFLGKILLVTELIRGESLENLLKAERAAAERNNYQNVRCKLNDRQLVTIALQIAEGMQHLEERKVTPVDCEVKFANLSLEKAALNIVQAVRSMKNIFCVFFYKLLERK